MKNVSEDILWRKVSSAYLPSKDDKELSLRFTQLLSFQSRAMPSAAAGGEEVAASYTKITRYFQLVRENRSELASQLADWLANTIQCNAIDPISRARDSLSSLLIIIC